MLAIVIPTIIAIVAFAWWFRAGNTRARYRPDFEYSGQIELVVWSIPALTVMLLVRRHLDRLARSRSGRAGRRARASRSTIQVVSLDWKWLFLYPDQKVASINELVAPVGAPLRLS